MHSVRMRQIGLKIGLLVGVPILVSTKLSTVNILVHTMNDIND